jgi:hypothetical protein
MQSKKIVSLVVEDSVRCLVEDVCGQVETIAQTIRHFNDLLSNDTHTARFDCLSSELLGFSASFKDKGYNVAKSEFVGDIAGLGIYVDSKLAEAQKNLVQYFKSSSDTFLKQFAEKHEAVRRLFEAVQKELEE